MEKAHTQSTAVQSQMTMNITNYLKRLSRKNDNQQAKFKCLKKLNDFMKPLKYVALFILILGPGFATPQWCIKRNLQ
jgi:hypothetical protein